jgi:hypothetical protein
LRIVTAVARWNEVQATMSDDAQVVAAHTTFSSIRGDLLEIGLALPDYETGREFLPLWRDWTVVTMESLSRGNIGVFE